MAHLSCVCTEFLSWEFIPRMCAFQKRGQGFYFFPDMSVAKQSKEVLNVVITITKGDVTAKELENEFEAYLGTGWRCTSRPVDTSQTYL